MLTIAIPTYNRNKILHSNLKKLLPKLTDSIKLVIYDNNSDIPVKDYINDLLVQYKDTDISIIRNKHNIGMTGNIMKCFYECETKWLWVLGDDDIITDNSIEIIFKDITQYCDYSFLTYAWDEDSFKRKSDVITTGLNDFLNKFETFGAILFLSTSIYNMSKIKKFISYGYFFQSTYAPHLVLLFMSLGKKGHCLYSANQIVINDMQNTPLELRWDQIYIYQLSLLLRLPLEPSSLVILKSRLEQLTRVWTINHLIYSLTFSDENKKNQRPTVLYDEIVRNFYHLDRRFITLIISKFGYLIIKFPVVFKPLLKFIYKLVKRRNFNANRNKRI